MTSGRCPSGFAAAPGRSVAAAVTRAAEVPAVVARGEGVAATSANVGFLGDGQLLIAGLLQILVELLQAGAVAVAAAAAVVQAAGPVETVACEYSIPRLKISLRVRRDWACGVKGWGRLVEVC